MIEGLKIRVPSTELATHLRDRAKYHRERADTKDAAMPKLIEAKEALGKLQTNPDSLAVMSKFSNSASYNMNPDDAIRDLESDIRTHRNKALSMEYLADHLFDEDYTLTEADLVRLEILKN